MVNFDEYWSIPKAVACYRGNYYDAEISFDQINYLIATGLKTRKEALARADTIIEPLITKFHKDCEGVIKQFNKAKA